MDADKEKFKETVDHRKGGEATAGIWGVDWGKPRAYQLPDEADRNFLGGSRLGDGNDARLFFCMV